MTDLRQYNVSGFFRGFSDLGLPFSKVFNATLAAATDTSLTVPVVSGMGAINSQTQPKMLALFSYQSGADVWVALNTAASAPAGAAFADASSVLNPKYKVVQAGDVIHAKCTAGCSMSVEFFYISEA